MAINSYATQTGMRYVVRIRGADGKWLPARSFDKRRDAQRYERELAGRRDRGERGSGRHGIARSVKDFFATWQSDRAHRISKGWHASQARLFRDYVEPTIGALSISKVRSEHVARILSAMGSNELSEQTRAHVYNILSRMFRDAAEYYGVLGASPVRRQDRPKVPRRERAFLEPSAAWRLLRASSEHYLGPAVWIGALAGLRPSEVQALRWESVDFVRNQILIRAAFKRPIGRIENYPKQRDWGRAPMPAALADYLGARAAGTRPDDFVAPALHGGMLAYRNLYFGLRALCDHAGVRRVSPHELRHTCTEIWFASGASVEDVRRVLNHKHAESTQRYVHRTNDRLAALAQAIAIPNVQNPVQWRPSDPSSSTAGHDSTH